MTEDIKSVPQLLEKPSRKPLVVIAGNYAQFMEYRRQHVEDEPMIYAGDDGQRIRGIENRGYIEVGTTSDLRNRREIILIARGLNR